MHTEDKACVVNTTSEGGQDVNGGSRAGTRPGRWVREIYHARRLRGHARGDGGGVMRYFVFRPIVQH